MTDASKDTGIILALVQRLETQRLPRARDIKARVDRGEVLTKEDIAFLDQVFKDAHDILPLAHKHPEWQTVMSGALNLYKGIMDKALENEQAASAGRT